MSALLISRLERQAEAARGRLADNLSLLKSSHARQEFLRQGKADIRAVQNELSDKARTALRQKFWNVWDGLLARAAENPSATLTIAAGLGWRFFSRPPVASALIGLGAMNLLRTEPATMHSDPDVYLDRAKMRLGEQTRELASSVSGSVSEATSTVMEKARDLATDVVANISQGSSDRREGFGTFQEDRMMPLASSRKTDSLLLGIAGLAVMGALGIAIERSKGDGQG